MYNDKLLKVDPTLEFTKWFLKLKFCNRELFIDPKIIQARTRTKQSCFYENLVKERGVITSKSQFEIFSNSSF